MPSRTVARRQGPLASPWSTCPAFVVELDFPLDVPEFGTVAGRRASSAASSSSRPGRPHLGLDLDPAKGRELVRAGALIKLAALEQVEVAHPVNPEIDGVNLVMLHTGDRVPGRAVTATRWC